jgi:hypothetical protein
MTTKQIDVPSFTKIMVNKGISLLITQGPEYKVEVTSGQNLINDIEVTVADNMLTLKDNTTCNWTRDYGQTVVHVTAPNITDIYSKTGENIVSDGILGFPNLRLVSMDLLDGYSGTGTGDYILQINNESLTIDTNNVSRYTLSGQTNTLNIHVWESNGIIDAQNLTSNTVTFYHRGTNDIRIHPVNFLNGDIYSVGDVISMTRPPDENIHVTQHYIGSLIFN